MLYCKCVIHLIPSMSSHGAHSNATDMFYVTSKESVAEWTKDGVNIVNG